MHVDAIVKKSPPLTMTEKILHRALMGSFLIFAGVGATIGTKIGSRIGMKIGTNAGLEIAGDDESVKGAAIMIGAIYGQNAGANKGIVTGTVLGGICYALLYKTFKKYKFSVTALISVSAGTLFGAFAFKGVAWTIVWTAVGAIVSVLINDDFELAVEETSE
jgi:hypothetical protein